MRCTDADAECEPARPCATGRRAPGRGSAADRDHAGPRPSRDARGETPPADLGTRVSRYRCCLPALAGFAHLASRGVRRWPPWSTSAKSRRASLETGGESGIRTPRSAGLAAYTLSMACSFNRSDTSPLRTRQGRQAQRYSGSRSLAAGRAGQARSSAFTRSDAANPRRRRRSARASRSARAPSPRR